MGHGLVLKQKQEGRKDGENKVLESLESKELRLQIVLIFVNKFSSYFFSPIILFLFHMFSKYMLSL